jgi:hypothetical protein
MNGGLPDLKATYDEAESPVEDGPDDEAESPADDRTGKRQTMRVNRGGHLHDHDLEKNPVYLQSCSG